MRVLNGYCEKIKNKTYDFRLWSSGNYIYVYQVKYLEDALSTGRDTSKNYLQDYISIIKQNGSYRLNVNKLIQAKSLDKTVQSNNINFTVKSVETYLDYEYYQIEITNHNTKEIIVDTRQQENTVYVKNSDGLKIGALLYENHEEELKIAPEETKTIKIKFNNTYNAEKTITCIGFSDVVYEQEKTMEVEINL